MQMSIRDIIMTMTIIINKHDKRHFLNSIKFKLKQNFL
jgi:hypothetical protein